MLSSSTWKRLLLPTLLGGALLLPNTLAFAETVTVKAGDTLGILAGRYSLTVEHLKIANHLTTTTITVGSTLYIPPKSTIYTVQQGDVLWKLASNNATTIAKIKEINQMTRDTLIVGEKLLIPVATSTSTTPPTTTTPSPTTNSGTSTTIPTGSTIYTVVSGDVLWKIADRYKVSIQSIVDANKLTAFELQIGQKLIIPSSSTSTGSTTTPTAPTTTTPSTSTPTTTTPTAPTTSQPSTDPVTNADGTITYTVISGDILWKIADRYKVTIQSIVDTNKLTTTSLVIGQKLIIPVDNNTNTGGTTPVTTTEPVVNADGTITYTVASGDILWKIADRYKVTIQAIMDASKLTSYELSVGQKLTIPASPVSTTNPTTPTEPTTGTVTDPTTIPTTPTEPVEEHSDDEYWTEMINYTVQKGDNGWTISIDHGIPMSEFLQVNNMSSSSYLQIGQVVKIPVHHVPELSTPGDKYGEYQDWFKGAQYLFPINAEATVTDFYTGKSFQVKRTIGAFHSDTEPLTAEDAAIIKEIWGGTYSWKVRPVIVEVDGRQLAGSMSSMPHDIEYIKDNNFDGHFDIHFLNSLRHKDGLIDQDHQAAIRVAAGISE